MNRRKFLQSAGIALGALALPVAAHHSLSAPSQPAKPLWAALQEQYQSKPDILIVSPNFAKQLWVHNGEPPINMIQIGNELIDLGGIDIIPDRFCPPDRIYLVSREQLQKIYEESERMFLEMQYGRG